MPSSTPAGTITIRLEAGLKDQFLSAARNEDRPASEILRELMLEYVKLRKRKQFEEEAQRESALIASSLDRDSPDPWAAETGSIPGWR